MRLLQWLAKKSLLRPLAPQELGLGCKNEIPGKLFTPLYEKNLEQTFSQEILELVKEPRENLKIKKK